MKLAQLALSLVLLTMGLWPGASRASGQTENASPRPNILWLSTEDIGPQLNCYGDPTASTPALDRLARQGMVYDVAWSNYPVCAPARTTIIAGMYAAANGAGNMRSSVRLPEGVELFPWYLRQAGYYCTNNSKTDYNYIGIPHDPWDESSNKAHYRKREPGQPFFAVFNYTGTHESKIRNRPHKAVIDPGSVTLAPYWPDLPEVRQDWAQYYDNLQAMDEWIAKHLQQLEASGEAENTIVVFFGDHGSGMPRHKRFAGDSGQRVPFVVYVPPRLEAYAGQHYRAASRTSRPTGFVDLAPTMLSLAGIEPKPFMQGHAFLGPYATPAPEYVYGFRDRMDERPDVSRSIRNQRYLYVRNYMPHLPAGQEIDYQQQTPTTASWYRLFQEGKLNEVQSQFWQPHPGEELYDLQQDPHETINLAADPSLAEVLNQFRAEHRASYLRFGDLGLIPESMLVAAADARQASPRALLGDSRFPLEEIFDAANLAANPAPAHRDDLIQMLAAPLPVLRYWGALGLMIDGPKACAEAIEKGGLAALVADESPAVATVAAEILARNGSAAQRESALQRLVQLADLRESNLYGAIAALNALDRLGELADPVRAALQGLPTADPALPRGKSYVGRLLEIVGPGRQKQDP